jgi:GNAT superfamily N-acetyltransferase
MPLPSDTHIRSFRLEDIDACRKLYVEGLIGGKLADNDTATDIDDIQRAYMRPGDHFWVAQRGPSAAGQIVGMVGVQQDGEAAAGVRRLRVRSDCRRQGIGMALMETALQFCHDHGYLKVTLDTFMDPEVAIRMFERFRFHHDRSRNFNGKELMYFYYDLYAGSAHPAKGDTRPQLPQG